MVGDPNHTNRFLLLYGTATGQAKAIAEEIAEKSSSFGLVADLHELDDIGKKFNLEKEQCVVIVVSTTGDGDPPPNAEKFMRRIKKRILSSTYLAHLHYALLGLGDSNYSNFCRCGRDMNTRLEALGAQAFHPPGFADDGVGLEVVADPWLKDLYPALQNFLGIHPANQAPVTETVLSRSHSKATGTPESVDGVIEDVKKMTISANGDGLAADVEISTGSSFLKDRVSNSSQNLNSDVSPPVISNNGDASNVEQLQNGNEASSTTSFKSNIVQMGTSDEPIPKTNNKSSFDTDVSVKSDQINLDHAAPDTSSSKLENAVQVSEDTQNIRAVNRQRAKLSVNGQVWPETPCEMLDKGSNKSLSEESMTAPLLNSQPPLCDQDLTIPVLPPPFLDISFSDSLVELSSLAYQNNCKLPSAASEVFQVTVSDAKVLTSPDAVKKTLLLRLAMEGNNITYSPGDSISIICPNNSSEVDLLIRRLQWEDVADQCMTLSVKPDTKKRRAAVPPHVHPCNSTLRHVLTSCVSIRDPPSKALLRALIEFTTGEAEKRRLQELCSKEGSQEYTKCLRQEHITLLDFLSAFPSCLPPPETLLEHLSRLQPRPYSACSCQKVTPNSLDIVFNLVEFKANLAEGHFYHRRGVCTGWLDNITASLQKGEHQDNKIQIPVFLRTNQHFRPPSDLSQPLIMIGPGTGVAPFIGFLEERSVLRTELEKVEGTDVKYGETWLYFGCRNRDRDFLFREQLLDFKDQGILTGLRVTFSRDVTAEESADAPAAPRYVQEQMRQDSSNLARLLTEWDALVYVCGDAKNMAADVTAAFEEILCIEKGMAKDEAHMFIMKKRIHKTYLEDVWL